MTKIQEKKEKNSSGALFIPAGVLIGIGMGFILHQLIGLTLIGLGCGFLAFALYEIITKRK